MVRICLPMQKVHETLVRSLGGEDPLEEEMATHSSVLAWRTPWTEEPGGLRSMGLQSRTRLSAHTETDLININHDVQCFCVVSE